jgi:hypothetical protein
MSAMRPRCEPMRQLRGHALAPVWCGIGCALLAAGGCGSPPPATTAAPSVTITALHPEPAGPCDSEHREKAVSVAKHVVRKLYGEIALAQPVADYGPRAVQPQQPGQAVTPPVYGWSVVFTISAEAERDAGMPGMAEDPRSAPFGSPAAPPDQHHVSTGSLVPGRIPDAPIVAAAPSAIPVASPDRPQPPVVPFHVGEMGELAPKQPTISADPQHPQRCLPLVASHEAAPQSHPRIICVFVAFDGTSTVL